MYPVGGGVEEQKGTGGGGKKVRRMDEWKKLIELGVADGYGWVGW